MGLRRRCQHQRVAQRRRRLHAHQIPRHQPEQRLAQLNGREPVLHGLRQPGIYRRHVVDPVQVRPPFTSRLICSRADPSISRRPCSAAYASLANSSGQGIIAGAIEAVLAAVDDSGNGESLGPASRAPASALIPASRLACPRQTSPRTSTPLPAGSPIPTRRPTLPRLRLSTPERPTRCLRADPSPPLLVEACAD